MNLKDPKPFRFKQFKVHHHLSTFKVNTDGVLLGCSADVTDSKTALDIGAGTGMISLILAQRNPSLHITGIEIDATSAAQAMYNAEQSPFADRVSIINADCFDYNYRQKYDLIVCNPPYFVGGTLPADANLSIAKHGTVDFVPRLIELAEGLLEDEGVFTFLLPYSEEHRVTTMINESNLFLQKQTVIKSYNHSEPYASMYALSSKKVEVIADELVLYIKNREYTDEHRLLTEDFML